MPFISRRLCIKDKINGLTFLIDTGADLSVIPFNFFSSGKQKPESEFLLSAPNGSSNETYGFKLLNVDLGLRRKFTHNFVLASVNKAIIGADFLAKFDLIVDLKRKHLLDGNTSLTVSGIVLENGPPFLLIYAINSDYGAILKEFTALTMHLTTNTNPSTMLCITSRQQVA